MKISQKCDCYDDGTDQTQVLNLSPEDKTNILDKKVEYVEPTLQTPEIEEQTEIDNQKFLGVKLEQNKIYISIEKDKKYTRNNGTFCRNKKRTEVKPDTQEIFFHGDDLFDYDDITQEVQKKLFVILLIELPLMAMKKLKLKMLKQCWN